MICFNSDIDRDKLVTDNLSLVWFMVDRLSYRNDVRALGLDEAFGVGQLTLTRCAQWYDQSSGWKFSTYACKAIRTDILKAAKREVLRHSSVELAFDPAERFETDDLDLDVERLPGLLEKLSNPRDAEVVRRYYGLGMAARTLEVIAAEMRVSQQMVSMMHRRAIAEMREGL